MQLKGLVRFFTFLLIIYSLYQLSITYFVRKHEKKMEAKARDYVRKNFPSALQKFPNQPDSQLIYQEYLDKVYNERLRRLLDSTRDVVITYGINGPKSYKKAKEEELNLGLDLQGGMSLTLEVDLRGLLRSLSGYSKDSNFNKALVNAENRKANSGADFITLFLEEYRKLEKNRSLASLFAGSSSGNIDIRSSDAEVESYIRQEAKVAFDRAVEVIRKRIDQFGVAQPNINPNRERGIINVELAGVKDKERVRKILQSTANLQFWEVYTLNDETYRSAWEKAIQVFNARYAGIEDTTAKKDTMASAKQGQNKPDTQTKGKDTLKESDLLSKKLGTDKSDTGAAGKPEANTKNTIDRYLHFAQPYQDEKGAVKFGPAIGSVKIKDTALFRQYLEELSYLFPSDIIWAYGIPERDNKKRETNYVPLYALRTFGREKPKLDGDAIADARQDFDELGRVEVRMTMNNAGASIWREMTRKNIGKPIAIVLDNIVYSAPNVITEIPNGLSSITGNFTQQEANDLAGILKAGKLPAPTKIVQEQQVGPTLGKAAIRSGSMAFVISFIVIFLLMLIYYNTSGWVANIALILNLLFTVGILAGLGATLTAPGIAGLVLTIGMAVDTNVIIYERIKEEITKGKSYLSAINEGYRRSLPPVLDAHITTLLTAIILFYFGLGPVKGFATTQIIGLILSMFCGILVSRWVTDWFTSKKKTLKYFTNISRRIFRHSKYKFIEYRKYTYGVSAIVLLLGIGAFLNGFDYGVEFNGGRSYQIRFDKPVDIEKVRADLRTAFEGENPIIKTLGNNTTLDITTSYQINNPSIMADSIVERRLMSGLKNFLPKDITFEKFDTEYKLGSNKVLPTISDDLKQGAIKALLFALVIIFLYIFVRFRDWRYSLGTIVALLHDVLVTLAVFSFARKIVPFPLEIDQHFIAAVLTVIGFSMNDTVIVFDRIREDSRLMPNSPRTEIINRAINETLSRTIMTSLTVFLTLLILFLVGGEVTKGFAFAMLIGVITGTYSSIFVAAPILVDLGGKRALGKKTLETEKQVQTNIQSAT